MPETPVQVSTASTGAPIMCEQIGTTFIQQVKLLGGQAGSAQPIPGDSSAGLYVQLAGQQTTVAVAVAGTVAVSQAPGLSVTISGMVVTNTGVQSVSGNVVVSGVVSVSALPAVAISGIVPVTTAASVSVSGIPVWLNPTQAVSVNTIAAGFSVSIGSAVQISGFQGQSVSAVVSGSVALSNIAPVTTQASVSVTGIPVWMNPTQGVTILGTQLVSVVPGVSVTISGLPVTISGIVPVTTQTSVSVSGIPVWMNPTQQVVVSGFQGQSVNAAISGIVPVTTAASVSVSGIPVWLNPTQQVAISGMLFTTTGVTTGTAQAVWVINQTAVTVSVSVSGGTNVDVTTAAPGAGATGLVVREAAQVFTTGNPNTTATGMAVWLAGGQSQPGVDPVYASVQGSYAGTAIGFYYTTALAGTVLTAPIVTVALNYTTAVTSMFVVPAGKVMVLYALNVQVRNTLASIGFAAANVMVVASTSSSVTVGPVYGAVNVAAITSATGFVAAGQAEVGVAFSAGVSVQFPVFVTGASSQQMQFAIAGALYP